MNCGNEPGGTRTHDPKIKSLVLYRLSYGLDNHQVPARSRCREPPERPRLL
jgi:hypothetical protein